MRPDAPDARVGRVRAASRGVRVQRWALLLSGLWPCSQGCGRQRAGAAINAVAFYLVGLSRQELAGKATAQLQRRPSMHQAVPGLAREGCARGGRLALSVCHLRFPRPTACTARRVPRRWPCRWRCGWPSARSCRPACCPPGWPPGCRPGWAAAAAAARAARHLPWRRTRARAGGAGGRARAAAAWAWAWALWGCTWAWRPGRPSRR
jgi:hypothetical protein